jgi:hypothetical protein
LIKGWGQFPVSCEAALPTVAHGLIAPPGTRSLSDFAEENDRDAVSCTGRKTVFCNFRELATVMAFKNLFGGPNGGKRCFHNPHSSIEGVKK